MIRMLTVAHAASPAPSSAFESPVAWQIAGPDTVADWSAACFFFARELQSRIRVPIGLVQATWSGANIRPWMSSAALQAVGGYDIPLKTLALYAQDEAAAQRQFGAQWEQWWRRAPPATVPARNPGKRGRPRHRGREAGGRRRRDWVIGAPGGWPNFRISPACSGIEPPSS